MRGVISWRGPLESTLPGIVVGAGTGLIAGGLAATGGLPAKYVALTILAMGVPLAIFGAGYDGLLASGRLRLGGVAPAALYWLLGFPVSRLVDEFILDFGLGRNMALPEALLPFLAYQAVLSLGYTIGFIWCHEHLAALWWPRIRDHNAVAARYVSQYTSQAAVMEQSKRKGSNGRKTSR